MSETNEAVGPEPDDYALNLLNTLIETTLDSVDGFEKAAALARNPRFQTLFTDKAQARRKIAAELQDEVRGLGAEPWDKGSFRGLAQRAFLELRDKVGGKSDKPVIDAVERDEDFIRDQFAEAANDEKLPQSARKLVNRLHSVLAADHAEISGIKQEFD
ncbi:MAG TPA: PA2169 family four-helix-bundle protein [Caulobacteraceae bacterium]|jgi:uncharacterized protein (TIGR02284 family)